jgi:hypothetical protein
LADWKNIYFKRIPARYPTGNTTVELGKGEYLGEQNLDYPGRLLL